MRVRVVRHKDGWSLVTSEGTFKVFNDGRVVYYAKDRPRTIGTWDPETGTYRRRVRPDAHVHRKTNSFAFPYALIAFLYKNRGLKTLVVDVEGEGEYSLDVEKIIKDGKLDRTVVEVRRYEDLETQIFIPRSYFEGTSRPPVVNPSFF